MRIAMSILLGILVVGMCIPLVEAKSNIALARTAAVSAKGKTLASNEGANPYALTIKTRDKDVAGSKALKGSVLNVVKLGSDPMDPKFQVEKVNRNYERPPVVRSMAFGTKLGGKFATK